MATKLACSIRRVRPSTGRNPIRIHHVIRLIGGHLPYHRPDRLILATSSLIVSVMLATAIFFLVRDRWNDPEVKATEQAEYSTTGTAARNAGARLLPTDPKLT